MAHRHELHDGDALSAAARAALEGAGEQWTHMRAAVFGALAGAPRPASAYDLADAVSRAERRRVAPNSVYRILDLFVGANLARRIESANAYVANAHPGCVHDCIYMLCDGCGAATHLDDDQLATRLRQSAAREGFRADRPVIELRGRCRACADA